MNDQMPRCECVAVVVDRDVDVNVVSDVDVFGGRLNVFLAPKFLGEIGDELLVDERVDVFAQLIEHEPVADLASARDHLDISVRRETTARTQQEQTDLSAKRHKTSKKNAIWQRSSWSWTPHTLRSSP